jgi:hypothetical protein
LALLAKYFHDIPFFMSLQKSQSQNTLMKVMSMVFLQKVSKGTYLINEGDEEGRFYINLSGDLVAEKAMEEPVPAYHKNQIGRTKILNYLQFIYDNMDKVYWARVPYATEIKKYMFKVRKDFE